MQLIAKYTIGEGVVAVPDRWTRYPVFRDGVEVASVFESIQRQSVRVSLRALTWSAAGREVMERGRLAACPDERRGFDSMLYDFVLTGAVRAADALPRVIERVERVFAEVVKPRTTREPS